MVLDIEAEKKRFVTGRISADMYATDDRLAWRTRKIFRTFARVLTGRGSLPADEYEAEMGNLVDVVRREVVHPLLGSHTVIAGSQGRFDSWHRSAVTSLKASCPISWDHGSRLTVGMAQKLINLHCKDLWTLDLVLS